MIKKSTRKKKYEIHSLPVITQYYSGYHALQDLCRMNSDDYICINQPAGRCVCDGSIIRIRSASDPAIPKPMMAGWTVCDSDRQSTHQLNTVIDWGRTQVAANRSDIAQVIMYFIRSTHTTLDYPGRHCHLGAGPRGRCNLTTVRSACRTVQALKQVPPTTGVQSFID